MTLMTSLPEKPRHPNGHLSAKHLTSITALETTDLHYLLDLAQYYCGLTNAGAPINKILDGKTQVNLFLENSTRTNMSFELAGKKLGATLLVLPVSASSVNKGEELKDTTLTLASMGADVMVVRNKMHNTASFVAEAFNTVDIPCAVVNAGDGTNAHPTQALLDAVTILDDLGRTSQDGLEGITIAICGDIKHSRVASSNMTLLTRLGASIRLVGPKYFHPETLKTPNTEEFTNLKEGLSGANYVMGLRVQKERMELGLLEDENDFYKEYGLTHETLKWAAPNAKIMHPGPMNRGVEIDGALADDMSLSLILKQVANGVGTRMAVLDALTSE